MKTLCIYHANCADGFGAAWVVRKALGADNVDFVAGHYGQPAPDVEGRDVIIVDFSYPYELLVLLGHQARSILIIDHHKTAAEALVRLQPAPPTFAEWRTSEQRVGTVFDMQRSGAGLTWDYLIPDEPRPRLINHIEDRDLWRFDLPGTEVVTAALFSHAQDFHLWDSLMKQHLSGLRGDGHAILRANAKNLADLLPSARRLTIGGHDVPTLNCPHFMASDAGHIQAQGEPFAACYSDTPKGRVFSLRSQPEGLDVAEVAKQYGGGGHRNAAGFTVPFDHELVTGFLPATLESSEQEAQLLNALREVTECLSQALTGGQVSAARAGRALVTASQLLDMEDPL
ncbi:phosphohydrolase [Pseudomonas fulva]|uniref:DHHA1 domain-containing protein n=1 Tax=Pseudomonas fulva TaxID=47880 RepID=UPI00201D76A8|nr:DHHA1 domain-containing protein [Pseudomonas fulva]UQY33790.1 phosphohydrolase [Pseudomonas fulva]